MSELWAQTQIKWWTVHFVENMVSEEKTIFLKHMRKGPTMGNK